MKIDLSVTELLLSSTPDAVFVVDADLAITYMNRAASDLTGLSEMDAIGRQCCSVLKASHCESGCVLEACRKDRRRIERRETTLLRPDGSELEVLVYAAPIFSVDGAFEGGIEMLRDVTEERRLRRESEAHIVRLERYHDTSMELALGLSEISRVLQELRAGNLEARVGPETLSSDDEMVRKLCTALNETVDEVQRQHLRVDEYHESSMELAMGLSECFEVLQHVREGNLGARVSAEVLSSSEELLANFGKSLNETTSEIQDHLETIRRQQVAIRELSTPILQLWENVLALPVIGTVDTMRSAEIMELLLARITETQCLYVILDITGVEVVDTKTADHFIKVIKAAELLGTTCFLTGMRPAVAQTLVDIGVDLSEIRTLRNLKEGLNECRRLMDDQEGGARSNG
jgi:rsbT co-antagonist protein RsbR